MEVERELPDSITVGPFVYDVTDDLNVALDDAFGATSIDEQQILLRKDLDYRVAAETLTHEVLHTLFTYAGIDAELGEKKTERLVRRLAPVLLDVMRRNPDLIGYLL